jgi:transcription elongation GreA/GreB family factor
MSDPHETAFTGPAPVVELGAVVELEYLRTGRRLRYLVRPPSDRIGVDLIGVSPRSPVGEAIMGAAAGDTVQAELPGGHVEPIRVLGVEPGQPA